MKNEPPETLNWQNSASSVRTASGESPVDSSRPGAFEKTGFGPLLGMLTLRTCFGRKERPELWIEGLAPHSESEPWGSHVTSMLAR